MLKRSLIQPSQLTKRHASPAMSPVVHVSPPDPGLLSPAVHATPFAVHASPPDSGFAVQASPASQTSPVAMSPVMSPPDPGLLPVATPFAVQALPASQASPVAVSSPAVLVSPRVPNRLASAGMTPRGLPITELEAEIWQQCILNVTNRLGRITSKVAITMGGTHGQIDLHSDKTKPGTRQDNHIPSFVRNIKSEVYGIIAAPFTVPHYGDDEDFKTIFAASEPEMLEFLGADRYDKSRSGYRKTTQLNHNAEVIAIADKMRSTDTTSSIFSKKQLNGDFKDSAGIARHALEQASLESGMPLTYTSYRHGDYTRGWGNNRSSVHTSVPLLNKTYLLTGDELREGEGTQHEWKFMLYYLGNDGEMKSINILEPLLIGAPFTRFTQFADDKGGHSIRPLISHKYITTSNIVKLIYAVGFKVHLHIDVTCNVIRREGGFGFTPHNERLVRMNLNSLYIPNQLAIQTGHIRIRSKTLAGLLVALGNASIAGGGRHCSSSGKCRTGRQSRRHVRHHSSRRQRIRTRRHR